MSQLKDLASDKREQELDKLFSSLPLESEILVDLPSRNKFYKNFQDIKVKPLLFEDEQRILISKNKNINPINEIISKCVEGINVSELLIMDKVYLLMKIKEVSYGPDYKFTIICPACNENINSNIDVSKDLPINYITDDITDPIEFSLPVLNTNIKVRLPRVMDEEILNDKQNLHKNIYKIVKSLNDNTDPVFIAKAVQRMHIRDIKTILKNINMDEFGIQSTFKFVCPECGHSSLMNVPFDSNFFSVN